MKNQFGASAKLAIGTVLFTVIIFFQNCSDINIRGITQEGLSCVNPIAGSALMVRGYTPVANGTPDTSEIHFEVLVDTGGGTFARSGYIADWTLDGVESGTADIFEIDTPSSCADHTVQATITSCGEEFSLIPLNMRFGAAPPCTSPERRDPPPVDTSGPTVSIPGTGGAAQVSSCGQPSADPNVNPFPPGYDLAEPGQPAACMNIVNWGQNSQGVRDRIINANATNDIRIANTLIRYTTMNTVFGTARCDLGVTDAGLPADQFISLRIDTTADYNPLRQYQEGTLDLTNGNPDNYRPFQTVISECVGDFGTRYADPLYGSVFYNRRATLGPKVGRCGNGSLIGSDHQPKLMWQIRSRADIEAAAQSTSSLVINGPCLLEEGKTYYINIIQSNPNNIFETICHDQWRMQGCSAPGSCPLTNARQRMSCGNSLILLPY